MRMSHFAAATVAALALTGCGPSAPTTTVVNRTGTTLPALGQPTATYSKADGRVLVLISDDAKACTDLLPDTGLARRSLVGDGHGGTAPSIMLDMDDGHFLGGNKRTVGSDLNVTVDPGGPLGLQPSAGGPCIFDGGGNPDTGFDGGFGAAQPCFAGLIDAQSGTAHLIHKDDTDLDDAQAAGDFDVTFADGGGYQGTFFARPCTQLSSVGCQSVGGLTLLSLLVPLGLWRRRFKGSARR